MQSNRVVLSHCMDRSVALPEGRMNTIWDMYEIICFQSVFDTMLYWRYETQWVEEWEKKQKWEKRLTGRENRFRSKQSLIGSQPLSPCPVNRFQLFFPLPVFFLHRFLSPAVINTISFPSSPFVSFFYPRLPSQCSDSVTFPNVGFGSRFLLNPHRWKNSCLKQGSLRQNCFLLHQPACKKPHLRCRPCDMCTFAKDKCYFSNTAWFVFSRTCLVSQWLAVSHSRRWSTAGLECYCLPNSKLQSWCQGWTQCLK